MSAILATAAAVVSSPLPTPSVVVQTIPQIVYVTPAWVGTLQAALQQLAVLALVFVPAYLASKAHNFVNPKLGKLGNSLLLYGYSLVLGTLGLVAVGSLNLVSVNWHNPAEVGTAVATAFLAAVGAATLQYNRFKQTHPESDVVTSEDVAAATTQF